MTKTPTKLILVAASVAVFAMLGCAGAGGGATAYDYYPTPIHSTAYGYREMGYDNRAYDWDYGGGGSRYGGAPRSRISRKTRSKRLKPAKTPKSNKGKNRSKPRVAKSAGVP